MSTSLTVLRAALRGGVDAGIALLAPFVRIVDRGSALRFLVERSGLRIAGSLVALIVGRCGRWLGCHRMPPSVASNGTAEPGNGSAVRRVSARRKDEMQRRPSG